MSSIRRRHMALLSIAALALVAVAAPQLGTAQDATPAPDTSALIAAGQETYETLCIACHRPGGEGAEGTTGIAGIPALAGNPFVTIEDPRPVVQTLLNGRAGMPAFRGFSDEEIAGIASYIRQALGNQAGTVDPALVGEVRAQYAVESPPDATPVATPAAGAAATPGTGATPSVAGTPTEAEAVPTLGQ